MGIGRVRADCFFCKIQNIHMQITLEWEKDFTFRRNGKHPGASSTGCASMSKSGVGHSFGPNTFNSRKQSVSIISFCHDIETEPVLNFEQKFESDSSMFTPLTVENCSISSTSLAYTACGCLEGRKNQMMVWSRNVSRNLHRARKGVQPCLLLTASNSSS